MNTQGQVVAALAVNETVAAQMLGMSVKTLQAWRFYGKGPKYLKIEGKAVRYRPDDLKQWLDGQEVTTN